MFLPCFSCRLSFSKSLYWCSSKSFPASAGLREQKIPFNQINLLFCSAFKLVLHSLTHLVFFCLWLSRNLIKFFCTIESMILLNSLAMVDSAYLFLRFCSSSLRGNKDTNIKIRLSLWPSYSLSSHSIVVRPCHILKT